MSKEEHFFTYLSASFMVSSIVMTIIHASKMGYNDLQCALPTAMTDSSIVVPKCFWGANLYSTIGRYSAKQFSDALRDNEHGYLNVIDWHPYFDLIFFYIFFISL